jgi:hypothetical protein
VPEPADAGATVSEPVDAEPGAGEAPIAEPVTTSTPATTLTPKTSHHRVRRVISVIFVVLAALLIPIATTAIWAARTVVNAGRFKATVSAVVSDPQVISAASAYVTNQMAEAVRNTGLLDNVPSALKPVVPVLGGALRKQVEQRVNDVLSSDAGQELLVAAAVQAHGSAMRLLQGKGLLNSEAFKVADGKITLNLLPTIRLVLLRLQQDGVIPQSISIPAPDAPPSSFATSLKERLPENFGSVVVYDSGTTSNVNILDKAQHALVVLKRGVVALVILALVCAVLAVLVAVDRRRALLRVGAGVALVCLILIVVVRRVVAALPGATTTAGARAVASALGDSLRSSLNRALFIEAIIAAVLAVGAWQFAALRRWAGTHGDIARVTAVVLGVVILLVLGLGWGSLIFAAVVVVLGLLAVGAAQRAAPSPPSAVEAP